MSWRGPAPAVAHWFTPARRGAEDDFTPASRIGGRGRGWETHSKTHQSGHCGRGGCGRRVAAWPLPSVTAEWQAARSTSHIRLPCPPDDLRHDVRRPPLTVTAVLLHGVGTGLAGQPSTVLYSISSAAFSWGEWDPWSHGRIAGQEIRTTSISSIDLTMGKIYTVRQPQADRPVGTSRIGK